MNSPYLIIDRSGNAVDINSTEPPTCHDHYRTCYGCPDRVADPNCHGTCKGYIDRAAASKAKSELIRAEKAKEYIGYKQDGVLAKRIKVISTTNNNKKRR